MITGPRGESIVPNTIADYLNEINLPNPALKSTLPISNAFIDRGVFTLWTAIEHVYKLPYGRTTNRADYFQVLNKNKGACSTKHALLAALSEELAVPLNLCLGFFLLTHENTPEVIPILESYCINAIPEAHTYLKYNNSRIDITFPNSTTFSLNSNFEQEIIISPEQIGDFKIEKHHSFIKNWIKDKPHLSFVIIWAAREEWIQMLSNDEH